MQETNSESESTGFKKKKKYVYLDKYELNKEHIEERIHKLERSLNVCYVSIGILVIWIVILTIKQ